MQLSRFMVATNPEHERTKDYKGRLALAAPITNRVDVQRSGK